MVGVLVHHGEISLKGRNFPSFEKKLVESIQKSGKKNKIEIKKIRREDKRILFESDSSRQKISEMLKKVLGIHSFSFFVETEKNMPQLEGEVEKILKEFKKEKITKVGFKTKRSDKQFPLNSVEINTKLGEIARRLGIKVDYTNFERNIFIEITQKKIYIYTEKFSGLKGLPLKTSGKVLCLLSGGIDSPVAAWLMMKRGCTVDFLHFHTFRKNDLALKGKIKNLVQIINEYQEESKLFLVPYSTYEVLTQGKIKGKYDLVLFKHFMLKVAEEILKKGKYDAIILGDSLGQVASQTIENIKSSNLNINSLIFRPLIAYDKQEIINLSRKIGTYDTSIEKYKDCCSILSKSPATKTKVEKFQEVLKYAELEEVIQETLKEVDSFEIK